MVVLFRLSSPIWNICRSVFQPRSGLEAENQVRPYKAPFGSTHEVAVEDIRRRGVPVPVVQCDARAIFWSSRSTCSSMARCHGRNAGWPCPSSPAVDTAGAFLELNVVVAALLAETLPSVEERSRSLR